jgi:Membrane MotB of proton-channel complex MotA/MotB
MFDEPQVARTATVNTFATYISLFLLLLVFFVVLFSIASVHRQRVAEVTDSIDVAFGRLPSHFGLLPPPDPISADLRSPEAFSQAVSALVSGFAPLTLADPAAAAGNLLEIDLPPERVFRAGSAELLGSAAPLLDRLALLLGRRPPGGVYRLTWRSLLGPSSSDSGAGDSLAEARAAGFAAALLARGCPPDGVALSMERGPGPGVRLEFAFFAGPGGAS